MKESTLKVLDDEDLEFVAILHSLGMQRSVASIITYLSNAGEAPSREIEQATRLSQPEVSMTIRDLRDENWISEHEVKTGGKGRPYLVYTLATPIDEIIKRLEDEKLKEYAEVIENIRKLKEMV
jgi:predicted transcriptional regulator